MHVVWSILAACVLSVSADPDFYSAWCPCKPISVCPKYFSRYFDDIAIFGNVPACKAFGHVRCCSSDNIPEGFDLNSPAQYFPEKVDSQSEALLQGFGDVIDHKAVAERDDVKDYKKAVEQLKRAIASGEVNPNPPCGCYTAGTCPGRYSTANTGRDVGCFDGFETCCFLDDPWPNYQVTNLTITAPCATSDTCDRFFGLSPFDISSFGALEPCYLGQNRCLDYLASGTLSRPVVVKPSTPKTTRRPYYTRPTSARRTTKRTTTTARPATKRTYPTTTTARPTTRRTYPTTRRTYPTTRRTYPTTRRTYPTTRRTYPTTRRTYPTTTTAQPTTRRTYPTTRRTYPTTRRTYPTTRRTYPTTRRTYPTTTTYRTTTRKLSQPRPGPDTSIIDFVNQGSYLPPNPGYGDAGQRSKNAGISFQLPF